MTATAPSNSYARLLGLKPFFSHCVTVCKIVRRSLRFFSSISECIIIGKSARLRGGRAEVGVRAAPFLSFAFLFFFLAFHSETSGTDTDSGERVRFIPFKISSKGEFFSSSDRFYDRFLSLPFNRSDILKW